MAATKNLLLNSLSSNLIQSMVQQMHPVELPIGTVLYEPDVVPTFGLFLDAGVASVMTTGGDGETVDVELIGCEGLVGSLHLLGPTSVPSGCSMLSPGRALRMRMGSLREMFLHSAELRQQILEFVQVQTATLGQVAGCNRMHSVEQRLARLLLTVRDRAGGYPLKLTQESLAEMLGAQRTTVSAVAAELQDRGLIMYTRGKLNVINHAGLERVACGCYGVCRDLLMGLYRANHETEERPERQNHHTMSAD